MGGAFNAELNAATARWDVKMRAPYWKGMAVGRSRCARMSFMRGSGRRVCVRTGMKWGV